MSGLTTLGIIHTAIALVAVFTALTILVREYRIRYASSAGKLYLYTTVLTCLTSLGIYQHGGFGRPHVLALLTLFVLGIAVAAVRTSWFGRRSAYVEMVAFSATLLFHFIPALTETGTRLPLGAPLFANAEDPLLKTITGALVVLFLAGSAWQIVWLGRQGVAPPEVPPATPA